VYLVVGLGNPGVRYEATRHNLGFWVLDRVARDKDVRFRPGFEGEFGVIPGHCVLLKPHTFMNRSGHSVSAASRFYGMSAERVLVAHDEVDLPAGLLRLKFGGGEAGHRGVRSISESLGTREYARLRLGVGRPPGDFSGTVAEFVLDPVAPQESQPLTEMVQQAAAALDRVLSQGLSLAMNEVNRVRS
jgi:peptidyl-tRNA hydrolase, PTH1 family